jgi:uncharacterized membrane protein
VAHESESRCRAALIAAGYYALVYLAWFVSCGLLIWAWFAVRGAFLTLYVALRLPRFSYAAADQWSFFVLSLVCLGIVIFAQAYYTRAGTWRVLAGRFMRVALPTLVTIALASTARWLATR